MQITNTTVEYKRSSDTVTVDNGSLYLSITPKFYTKVLHQTTGLTPN